MSRLTDTDGYTPLRDCAKGEGIDDWVRLLAVPGKTVGSYYRGVITFEQLAQEYRAHLAQPSVRDEVLLWAQRALTKDITFLCYERTAELCHRRLLAEECKILVPSLELYIG